MEVFQSFTGCCLALDLGSLCALLGGELIGVEVSLGGWSGVFPDNRRRELKEFLRLNSDLDFSGVLSLSLVVVELSDSCFLEDFRLKLSVLN